MSDNKQETIADIIAEMRGFKRYAASDSSDCRYVAYWLYQTFADRLEAAHKRELGDCAKMREALEQAKVAILAAKEKMGVENPIILEIIDAALSAPPRNCDVGTAKEQMARFKYYCQHIGRRCFEDEELRQKTCTVCLNEWAQMPYEEGGDK